MCTTDLYLVMIEVAPSHPSAGLGSRIVADFVNAAVTKGLLAALRVLKSNPRARRLHERMGFRVDRETATHFEMAANEGD